MPTRMPLLGALLTVATIGSPIVVEGQDFKRDSSWTVAFDQADAQDSSLFFVIMQPGWHVTTPSPVTLYQPDSTAAGHYMLKAVIYEFPGTTSYGVSFGGQDLGGPAAGFWVFGLDGTGRFAVTHFAGIDQHPVVPWTKHEAIATRKDDESTAKNVLVVAAGPAELGFYVNGTAVHRMDREGLEVDGVFGLRAEANADLHVGQLTVVQVE